MSQPIIRLVVDSNVYIAAASPRSYIAQFLFASKASINPYRLYVSPQILVEVQAKLIDRLEYPQPRAVAFVQSIQADYWLTHLTRESP